MHGNATHPPDIAFNCAQYSLALTMALRERKSQKEEENEVPPVAPKPTVSARQEKLIVSYISE